MNRTLLNLGMMTFMVVAILAVGGNASAQGRHGGNGRGNQTSHQPLWRINSTHGHSGFGLSHKKDSHGYRNYGQYRRTQVGNRRLLWSRRHGRPSLWRRLKRTH
jgi:hypothetical protein